MSDGSASDIGGLGDYNPYYGAPSEIWDPYLGKYVYISPPTSAGEVSESGHVTTEADYMASLGPTSSPEAYMAANWDHYDDYYGPVAHASNTPITPEFYFPDHTLNVIPEGTPDWNAYRRGHMGTSLYGPDAGYAPQMQQVVQDAYNQVYVMPAVRPFVGYIPGAGEFGPMNLYSGLPIAYYDTWFGPNSPEHDDGVWELTPEEEALANFFTELDATPFPKYNEVVDLSQGNPLSGRGYEYVGTPSPELQDVNAQILAGNITPATVNARDQMVQPMIQEIEKSDMQQIADIAGPAIIGGAMTLAAPAVGAAMWGPIGAAAFGAGMGALTSGTFTKWDDPLAVGLGALGGGVGGYVGGAAGGAVGEAMGATAPVVESAGGLFSPVTTLSPGSFGFNVASGIGGGIGGAAGSYVGQSAATGFEDFDPMALGMSALSGAASGAAGGATGNPFVGKAVAAGLGGATDIFGNSTRRRRSPY